MRHCTRLLLLLATLWFAACGTIPQTDPHADLPPLNRPLAELRPLQDWLAERPMREPQNILLQPQLEPTSVNDYLIELAKILYQQGRNDTTELVLERLDEVALNPNQLRSYAIIQAYNAWALGRPQVALDWLQPPYRDLLADLPWPQRLAVNQLKAHLLSADEQYLAAAQLRHQIYPLLAESERQAWVDALWLDIRSISELELSLPYALDSEWDAWLELVRLERLAAGNLARLQTYIEQWQQQYPNHPARQYRPNQIVKLLRDLPQAPQTVALILPLPDNLSGPGHRILEGFLAGYYQDKQAGEPVPTIRLYHEHSAPSQTLVQLAIDEGAELIIGPLDRHNVAELESLGRLPFPILALNRTPRDQGYHPQIIQLALAPEDEARQVARLARQSGHQVAALMVPEGNWGDRVAQALTEAWLELEGRLVQRQTLPTRDDGRQYLAQVQTVLDIAQSQQRASNIQAVLGRSVESEPRPRTDLDVIFLATNPEQTRQIVSLLNFQLADDIQLMTLSAAVASSHSERDQALSGLWVVETPWRLNPHPLHSSLQATQEADAPERFDRLHALGLDAWHLVAQMPYIQQQHWVRFHGQTGVLQLNEQQQLVRELSAAEFRSGRLVPLSRLPTTQAGPAPWHTSYESPQR